MQVLFGRHLAESSTPQRPPTLETLVEESYLRGVPVDPMTRSNESWEIVYEEIDPEAPPAETDLPVGGERGVFDVRSASAWLKEVAALRKAA